MTIKNIKNKIFEMTGRSEDYLIHMYPDNYFDFYIDIGSRGIVHPWHLNFLAKKNTNTSYYGFEPDLPYYEELIECKKEWQLRNLDVSKLGFGTGEKINTPYGEQDSITVDGIFKKHGLSPQSKWAIKLDCEGAEYALMKSECDNCVELLKQASHIAIEFHLESCRTPNNFWTRTANTMPTEILPTEEWLQENFNNSHDIFLTEYSTTGTQGLYTYVLAKKRVLEDKNVAFWEEILL